MALLITGGTGYVGSHFLASLTPEERASCLAPGRAELNIEDRASVDRYFSENSINAVMHLAACLNSSDDRGIVCTNISAVMNLCSACRKYGVKQFIFISGNNVYGENYSRPFCETDLPNPAEANKYGLSKYCGELLVKDQLCDSNTAVSIVRIGDIYGPSQKTGALLKAVVGNITSAQPQKLYGEGDRTRDYIYIDDVVDGLKFVLKHELRGTYNLATGVGTSVREIVQIAEELSECKEATIPVTVENEDHSKVVLNVEKLKKAGWSAKVSFPEGLKKIVEEKRNNNG